ncbi:universal stress protein [Parasporobacterium paucivorans]|uniref:Nucleotide-binding universal stress protein, UspA family n=1 Tax=Parasporobacterium paucivorans DSM 15970 TaxID=1122934 RepID=A0A1M6KHX2_9FIRM|nr:universal stress protein [Parasporobacterium paucivorans]SHJ58514.1 Nucleotide-binding universal stress protein, UspA family [Parasporobacterium paucivorans DSM 15970]
MEIKKILVPIDSSAYSRDAAERAKSLAGFYGSEIILLNAIDISNIYQFDLPENIRAEYYRLSTELLQTFKQNLDAAGYRVTTVQREGVPYDVIIGYAEEADIDLIVMGSQGTSGVTSFLLGSVTRKVAIGSHKSVLIVR